MNFGEAIFGKSKHKHPLLIYDSIAHPGKRYEFHRSNNFVNSEGVETVYYCCIGCKKMKTAKIPMIAVRDGHLFTNPDAPNNTAHSCTPIDIAKSEAVQLDREIRAEIHEGRKRPREAFREAEAQIHQKFARYDEGTRASIEQYFPDFKNVKYSYNRIARKSHPKPQKWDDVQFPPYCLTIGGKDDANDADSLFGERLPYPFILYLPKKHFIRLSLYPGDEFFGEATAKMTCAAQTKQVVCDVNFHPNQDEELAKKKQKKQELSADLDLAMSRADQVDELKTALASAHETNAALQKFLWKSFPSECFYYHIKIQVPSRSEKRKYRYLHVDEAGHLRIDDRSSTLPPSTFDFTKNFNGSFSIKSTTNKTKFMQSNIRSSRVEFTDSAGEFVLFFHPQNQQAGLLLDICSLAGNFLCMNKDNFVVANSSDPPAHKFLIIPAVDE